MGIASAKSDYLEACFKDEKLWFYIFLEKQTAMVP